MLCSQLALSCASSVAHDLINTMTLPYHVREAPCLCRYLDGSVDMLDQFMADSAWPAMPHSCDASHTAPSATVLGLQPLSHSASSADAQLQATAQCTKSTAAQKAQQALAPLADVHARPSAAPTARTDTPCANVHSDLPDKAFQRSTSCQEPQQGIPVWHKDDLSYEQFVQMFMQPNLPVMLQVSCMTGLCIGMALACMCCTLHSALPALGHLSVCADKPWEFTHMQVDCHSGGPQYTSCPQRMQPWCSTCSSRTKRCVQICW